MSFFNRLCLFVFIISISAVSVAQQGVFVVDVERAALSSKFAKGILKEATNSDNYKKGVSEFDKLRDEFKGLQNEGKANGLTWSDEQKKAFNAKIEKKLREVQQLGGQLESARAALQNRIIKDLTPDIEKIVQGIIKKKKIDVLMNAKAVYFQKPEFNITAELSKQIDITKKAK